MIIRIFEKGATVTFSCEEAEKKIDYKMIDPESSLCSWLSTEKYEEEVREKIAGFAVMNNISNSMSAVGPGTEDKMKRNTEKAGNQIEYVAGSTDGELIKEVTTDIYQVILSAIDFYGSIHYDTADDDMLSPVK